MPSPSDVVVVGAGVIGCAIAYELARRGTSVKIVDDRPAGMGATQAAAGVLAPFIEGRHGGALLELTARSLDLFDIFIARLDPIGGTPINYQRTGTIDVATEEGTLTELQETANILRARGVPASLLDPAQTHEAEPQLSNLAIGSLLVPSHGFVGAADLTRALVGAARRHGAQMLEQGRVTRICPVGTDLRVDTERGSLTAGAVVLAAGSWSGQIVIEGVGAVPVRPVRGQLVQLGWSGQPLARVTWSERCYLVPWKDGTMLVGATVEEAGFDERTTVAGVRDLIEAAADLVPQAWSASFRAAKVGLRPGTPDGLPIVGRSAVLPNLFYATGHYRNGVLLSPLTAQLVSDLLLEDHVDPILSLTSPQRFGAL